MSGLDRDRDVSAGVVDNSETINRIGIKVSCANYSCCVRLRVTQHTPVCVLAGGMAVSVGGQ